MLVKYTRAARLENNRRCYAGCLWEGHDGAKEMMDICARLQFVFDANE